MPLPVQTPINKHTGNGVTTEFAFEFAILSLDDLKVQMGGSVVTTGFTVSGIGDRTGGSVTFSVAPVSDIEVILYREVVLDRTTDYQENGDLLASTLDDDIDRVWMALQDQLLIASRALRVPLGELLNSLPDATARALRILGFDAAGQPAMLTRTDDGGSALALDLLDAMDPSRGAGMVGFNPTLNYAMGTIGARLREWVNVRDFPWLAKGDGSDDLPAINAALATGLNVDIGSGNYRVSGPLQYTAAGQWLRGVGCNGINIVSLQNPLDNVNLSQIYSDDAVTLMETGNFPGTKLSGVCFNGNGVAANGVIMAPAADPLVFAIEVDDIYINAVTGTALDTGFVVDSVFSRVRINGATHEPFNAALTTVGIRVGATNNSFDGCWVHNSKTNVNAVGTVAHWSNCTFSTLYAADRRHIDVNANLANWDFEGCYFENATPIRVNGAYSIGALNIIGGFLQSMDPNNLIDLTGATAGRLLITGTRLHETSPSTQIRSDAPVGVAVSFVGQAQPSLLGTANFSLLRPSAWLQGTSTFKIANNKAMALHFSSATGNGGEGGVEIRNKDASAGSSPNPALLIIKGSNDTGATQRFLQFFSNDGAQAMGYIGGNGANAVGFVSTSDRRLKEHIEPLAGALEAVLSLKPVSFDWRNTGEHVAAGFIAQDVGETELAHFVVDQDDTMMLTGNMGGVVPYLVRAIQEQQAQIEQLRERINP